MPISLNELEPGEKARITKIKGDAHLANRIAAMGLAPGSDVIMIRNNHGKPVIINARYTFIALGRTVAGKILTQGA